MPDRQNNRLRVNHAPQLDTSDRQRAPGTRVVARPVDTFVAPGDNGAQALMEGLSTLNPALQRYSQYRDLNDEDAGERARAAGEVPNAANSGAWRRGYMRMDGMVKGQQDTAKVLEAYDAWSGKDGGDIEGFISSQVGSLTTGMEDATFRKGYLQSLTPALDKLRGHFLEHNRKQVLERSESNAMLLIENAVRGYLSKGEPVPDEFIDSYRGELNRVMGINGSRFNDLLFGAAKRLGDEGNFAIFDMFKRPRPDGTPGMYFIPAWKEKIDTAQIQAQQAYLRKQEQARVQTKAERDERQESALFDVFDLLTKGDERNARARFDELRADRTLFSRASDVIKWEKLFDDTSKREARPEQQANEAELLAGAITGRLSHNDVLRAMNDGQITVQQARRVIADISKIRSEQRSAAAAERGAAAQERSAAAAQAATRRAIFETPQFRMNREFIEDRFRAGASPLDPFGTGTAFDRALRANAQLRFAQEAARVDPNNANELNAVRDRIVADMDTQRSRRWDAVRKDPRAAGVRYTRIDDAVKAAKEGRLTPAEFEAHIVFFESHPDLLK